jgi:hypothetical protein
MASNNGQVIMCIGQKEYFDYGVNEEEQNQIEALDIA